MAEVKIIWIKKRFLMTFMFSSLVFSNKKDSSSQEML